MIFSGSNEETAVDENKLDINSTCNKENEKSYSEYSFVDFVNLLPNIEEECTVFNALEDENHLPQALHSHKTDELVSDLAGNKIVDKENPASIANNDSPIPVSDTQNPTFYDGNASWIIFAGPPEKVCWEKCELKTFFFLTPNCIPLCLRISSGTKVSGCVILKELRLRWRTYKFDDPILTLYGKDFTFTEDIWELPDRSTFIVFDVAIDDEFLHQGKHSGKAWSCSHCGKGYYDKRKFLEHSSNPNHKLLFKDELKDFDSFGRVLDRLRSNRPWGCPKIKVSSYSVQTIKNTDHIKVSQCQPYIDMEISSSNVSSYASSDQNSCTEGIIDY